MNRMIVKSKVGSDGILKLDLPFGAAEANREVQVTVEPISVPVMERGAWRTWVQSMAGAWKGEFERALQGELEEREPLS